MGYEVKLTYRRNRGRVVAVVGTPQRHDARLTRTLAMVMGSADDEAAMAKAEAVHARLTKGWRGFSDWAPFGIIEIDLSSGHFGLFTIIDSETGEEVAAIHGSNIYDESMAWTLQRLLEELGI